MRTRPIESAPRLAWNRVPGSTNAERAIEYLMVDLEGSQERKRARRSADRKRLLATLRAVVCGLYAASMDSEGAWRSYSRAKGTRVLSDRYDGPQEHTVGNIRTVTTWLLDQGFAEGQKGHYKVNPFGGEVGTGLQSRIGATQRLVDHMRDFQVQPSDIGHAEITETIILKGEKDRDTGNAPKVEYTDTSETNEMRESLRAINGGLSTTRLSRPDGNGGYEDLPPFYLYRVFNRSSFALGGRFYGGPWINLPPGERRSWLIDGEGVCELDYQGLHPRMMYSYEGQPLAPNADPYDIEGWREGDGRSWVKQAFQQLINANKSQRLKKPEGIKRLPEGGWASVLDAVAAKHTSISGWFRSGRGLELQKIDSDIAELVLLDMLGQGICCLPVHDSFIVPSSQADVLHAAMTDAYCKVLKEWCGVVEPPVITR